MGGKAFALVKFSKRKKEMTMIVEVSSFQQGRLALVSQNKTAPAL
jgi:hypothetical protein